MPDIKTVGIVSKPGVSSAALLVPELMEWLERRGLRLRYDQPTGDYAGRTDAIPREQVPIGTDLVIVLGGDGTLLSAARAIGRSEVPLFPVNLGGLGFLTAITIDEIYPELERAFRGEHRMGKRRFLHIDVIRGEENIASHEALNDAVLSKSAIARMIDLQAYVDEQFVCAYKADGLIISTPTGSTAYSLSAGGPIIYPSVPTICMTPICPHMLTNRPVLVPETSVIRVISGGEDESVFLTIDGQIGKPLRLGDVVLCRSSDYALHLIRPPRMMFFDVLRAKLKWGER
jgi:NAD+ kinase